MTRSRRRVRAAIALSGALALGTHGVAAATDGNLYPLGASPWALTSPFSASWHHSAVLVQAPAVAGMATGDKWLVNWRCPVPGSEIAHVAFGGLRTAAPSSLAVRVTAGGSQVWAVPDADLPQSPAGGAPFTVGLPGGACDVSLALTQVQDRAQHQRGYFIDNPRAVVRDITAPSVNLRHISQGWFNAAPRQLVVGWSTADNFGADGVGVQHVIVSGRTLWTGSPGVGDFEVALDPSPIGDGAHIVLVRADGDGTAAGGASHALYIDRTPPSVDTAPPAYPGHPRVAVVGWQTGDATSGVATSRAEIAHGGSWTTLAERAGPGFEVRGVTVPAFIPDGVHPWRVVASDHAGNAKVAPGQGTVVVDSTPPELEIERVPDGWTRTAEVGLRIDDNLAGVLGLGPVEIDVNAAPDGGTGGAWVRATTARPGPGAATIPLDLAAIPDGVHRMRVTARNGGAFGDHLATRRTATLRLDRTPPTVARADFTSSGVASSRAAWGAQDATSGLAAAAVQWADGATWRTIGQAPTADGLAALELDTRQLGVGEHRVRLVVADRAGNVAVAPGTLRIPAPRPAAAPGRPPAPAPAGAPTATGDAATMPSTAPDPLARLRTARLAVGVPGARVVRTRRGRVVLVRALVAGRPARVNVRLTDRAGRPIGGVQVEARGHRGMVIGRGRTRPKGGLRMVIRPQAGGPVRIGVPAGRALLPARAVRDVRLRVRARVALRPLRRRVRTGEMVVFSGRVLPAPGRLGLAARKGVVLEWRDPLRGVWRPVVNARVRRNGTFVIPWRFALRGLAIPIRARVPAEIGWPLLPALSRPMVVTPR